MKFQKINDNVIRCTLSREEMQIQGINIDDLMDDRGKAEEFLQYVLTKARVEVDFVTNGDVLNVQLSVMKDGEVSLMISDDQHAAIKAIAEQFKDKLVEFSKSMGEKGGEIPQELKKELKALEKFKEKKEATPEAVADKKSEKDSAKEPEGESKDTPKEFWSRLQSLDDCIQMAAALSAIKDAPSSLYKYYGEYYLSVQLDFDKSKTAQCVFIMSEYSDDVSSESNEYLMVCEHGEVILCGNALERLVEIG